MMTRLHFWIFRVAVWLMPFGLIACGTKPEVSLPPPPAETVVAKVAIPVPCEIAHVDQPSYPASQARRGDNVFDLAKIASADRRVRIGEIAQLRAANKTPCPGASD